MKVALVHYHLRPGGVATVIRDQATALRGRADCLVLSGEAPAETLASGPEFRVRVVPGLAYSSAGRPGAEARETARAIRQAMADEWGASADVVHVHNPLLNKNARLPEILRHLQDQGMELFLQVHDFAEDGRPSSYYGTGDYPRDCHIGVINSRGREALLAAGCSSRGVHLMWNLVKPLGPLPRRSAPRRRGQPLDVVYPVRAIRRKNIGEALLVSMLLDGSLTLTLPPRDEGDAARYSRWKEFAGERGLAAVFEAGLSRPLEQVMGSADGVLTTSVNEGFGFAFLEPWTAGIPVGGRRVDHVCGDFETDGVRNPLLYAVLPVPVDCFDVSSFSERWRASIGAAFRAFGKALPEDAVADTWRIMTGDGMIDFACLDEQAQAEVIARLQSDRRRARLVARRELGALRKGFEHPDRPLADANASHIKERYGPQRYGALLSRTYDAVLAEPVAHRIDRQALLEFFLRPENFKIIAQR
ncbi:MAG TPA: hypothetical protein VMV03_01660 [Spirochaetia bacterium]|nr:hypothetical protein [Spirochaetia bacterium]